MGDADGFQMIRLLSDAEERRIGGVVEDDVCGDQ